MAYGPLAQCAFMSGPSRLRKKGPALDEKKQYKDSLAPYKPPDKCEAPPPGSFMLYCFDTEEVKEDPNVASRSLPLEEMSHVRFGSSQEVDGMVYDGHKSVKAEHACIYFLKNRWFLKAVNGPVMLESMTLHPHLKDSDGKAPKRYTSTNHRKIEMIEPMDPKKKLTREMCVIRLGDSDRRFWIGGPLPLGEGETEESGGTGGGDGTRGDRKKDKREKENERERRDRRDDRSRSRKRRR